MFASRRIRELGETHFLVYFAILCAVAACASGPRGPESTIGLPRFLDPDRISVAPDDTLPRPVPTRLGPHYPDDLRAAGVTGLVVAAFVIDSTGRAELRTVSFVEHDPHPGFQMAVCGFLQKARFIPSRAAGVPRRALVFMPFLFSLGLFGHTVPEPDMTRYTRLMRETPPREIFAQLERYPGC